MHHLGRNPDDGQAEHENAVAVTSLIEITSPLNTLFVKRERDCQLAKHLLRRDDREVASDCGAPTTSLVQGGDWCKL